MYVQFCTQKAPKDPKITIFLQNVHKPKNILKRLQNNYNVFKNTYIWWLQVGKIHGIWAGDCLGSLQNVSFAFDQNFDFVEYVGFVFDLNVKKLTKRKKV